MAARIDRVGGRNPVLEALKGRRRVFRVYYARGLDVKGTAKEILSMSKEEGISLVEVNRVELEELSGIKSHQGFVAEVEPFHYLSIKELMGLPGAEEVAFYLVLDRVEDPQNLGSLIRVAEGSGCRGLVLGHRHSSPITPAVCKASAGAVEHLPLARVSNIAQAIDLLKSSGVWVVGADMDGETPYYEVDLTQPTAVVLGGEGRGLRRLVKEKCDFLVRISLYGRVNSLNVATAGAVILFEARRQREGAVGEG